MGTGPGTYVASPALLTWVLALVNFMQVLDNTISNVSLPAITGDLGASPSQGAWIVTSYTVAQAITVPLTGWVAGRFGQVRVMLAAVFMFGLTSLLSGFAWSLESMICFRVLQGAAGGFMVPLSQALMLAHNPPERRGQALALWSSTTIMGPVMGPVLGGFITDNVGWHWIFLVNVPVSVFAGFAVWRMLRGWESRTLILPLDWVGLMLLVLWVGSLQIVLDTGNHAGWFDSAFIVTLSVVAGIGFVLFLIWELTDRHPVVDLSFFRNRNFVIAVIAMALAVANQRGPMIILPLWLQTHVGYTAQWAGFVLAPSGFVAMLLVPFVGRSLRYIEPRIFATACFAMFGLSYYWRAHFTADADYWTYAMPQFIQGFGVAMFFAPLMTMSMSNIPPERFAAAAGLQNFTRTLMGSFGISAYVSLWEQRGAVHRSQLAEHMAADSPQTADYAQRLAELGMAPERVVASLDLLLTRQAFTMATNDIYWVSVAIAIFLMGWVWFARPPFDAGHRTR
jgi:DHA2 family multidrug resistance protein